MRTLSADHAARPGPGPVGSRRSTRPPLRSTSTERLRRRLRGAPAATSARPASGETATPPPPPSPSRIERPVRARPGSSATRRETGRLFFGVSTALTHARPPRGPPAGRDGREGGGAPGPFFWGVPPAPPPAPRRG